jgi:hypothetical protein
MYIEIDRDEISRLRIEKDGETYVADFNEDNEARVTKDAGEAFAERYAGVEIKKREDKGDDEDEVVEDTNENTNENEDN